VGEEGKAGASGGVREKDKGKKDFTAKGTETTEDN
jgi:hypothetical protein